MGTLKKQTAVEWLVEQLNENIDFIPMDKWDEIRDMVQQAKAMEKEQIQSAYKDGLIQHPNDFSSQEQYYKETYGGEK
jgi:hypothetical protein